MSGTTRAGALALSIFLAGSTLVGQDQPERQDNGDSFRFKSGVELVNVDVSVSDATGRFVSGLGQDDFSVFEDEQPQTITHFTAERVPVSLGIVIDTSGSMAGEKIDAARSALNRFLYELLNPDDEVFLYQFSNFPILVQGWTKDKSRLSGAMARLAPNGGTAMYDAVAEALPLATRGQNRKKALVVISDGNDTSSRTTVRELKQRIRESEVLVYAVGIDGESDIPQFPPPRNRFPTRPRQPTPFPFPFPPRRGFPMRSAPQIFGGGRQLPGDTRVNVTALRDMTDDSGGRTEIVRDTRDLEPATTSIADELSKQYYLGYASTGKKDGQWHAIRVEVKNRNYHIRARRGYVAN